MNIKTCLLRIIGSVCLLAVSAAGAQGFPDRPIKLLVPYGAASSTDALARILAEAMSAEAKQPVLVENKPGAEGFIGVQAAASAAPDGYTILISTNSTQSVNVHLFKKLPYDPLKDFIPVRTLGQSALGMSVNAESPYKTVADFVAAARASPGKLTFGSATATTRLAGEMLQQLANVKMLNVPYKANAATVTALLGREIDVMFSDTALTIPQMKAGRFRIIGVTGTQRMAALPDVPTMQQAGVPDYYLTFWYGAWLPAKTPPAVVAKVNELLANAMRSPAAQTWLKNGGADNFELSGEEFMRFQTAEIDRVGRVVKAAGIEPQ